MSVRTISAIAPRLLAFTLCIGAAQAQFVDPAAGARASLPPSSPPAMLETGHHAIDFIPGSGSCGASITQNVGWQFDIVNPITIDALTWFDAGQDGLDNAHEVGLWDPTGTLLASVVVPAGTAAPLDGIWRAVSIPPLALPVGAGYIVGGVTTPTPGCLAYNVTQWVHPDIVFIDATLGAASSVLTRPTFFSAAYNGFYGPGLRTGGSTANAYCFGDGSGTLCPCGNNGAPGRGCGNGMNAGGGLLASTGSSSIGAANLVLNGSGVQANQAGLYFQGDNATVGGNGFANGDGLRCAGGNLRRLQVRVSSPLGESNTTVNIAVAGAVNAGDTKRYQLWYRNPLNSPCGTNFNLTNGVEITWQP